MKYIKIAVAVVILGLLAFFIWKWFVHTERPEDVSPSTNQYVKRLEQDINSIDSVLENVFCYQQYQDINKSITRFYDKGELGKGKDNEVCAERLRKTLYSKYVNKFLQQADYIFKHDEWKTTDLNIIKKEVAHLQKSEFLEPNSPGAQKLEKVQQTLKKYDEVNKFIATCKNFTFSDFNINTEFDGSVKVDKAKSYLNSRMDGTLVNNCKRLKDDLKECPRYIYKRHKEYLAEKLNVLYIVREEYKNYNNQDYYNKQMYTPLNTQLNSFRNNLTYGVDYDTRIDAYDELRKDFTSKNQLANKYLMK